MKTTRYLFVGGMVLSLFTFMRCSSDENSLPKIDGYNNSSEVAASNLLANWTFDGTHVEKISGAAPLAGAAGTFGTVGFEAGQIGQALKLTQGALRYPNIAALNTADALANYTVSMWVKMNNDGGLGSGEGYKVLFGLFPDGLTPGTVGTSIWGNIHVGAESSWFQATNPQPDTLVLKGHFVKKYENGSINEQQNRPDPRGNPPVGVFKKSGDWVHFVVRWDASTQMLHVIGNGISIGAFTNRSVGNAGAMRMNVPCSPVFGNGATKAVGFTNNPNQQVWSPMATASIDDVRVFNIALSDEEITALFNLGTAGR